MTAAMKIAEKKTALHLAVDNTTPALNDAEMVGTSTAAMDALLNIPVTLLTGELWGLRDKRNTQDEKWNPVTMPWSAWIVGGSGRSVGAAPWGFSHHPVGGTKEGSCIVLGLPSTGRARPTR